MAEAIPILYESEDYLVLDKPFGVTTNNSHTQKASTVQDFVKEYLNLPSPTKSEIIASPEDFEGSEESISYEDEFINRSGLVHRLDKDTSGVLLVAKNPDAFAHAQKQFKVRKVEKVYWAVLIGELTDDELEIDAPISRSGKRSGRFEVAMEGRESVTFVKVLKRFEIEGKKYTLVEIKPATGRTHQIRVHMKALGHCVAGDVLYCSRKEYEETNKTFGRLMLHALSIKFIDKHNKVVFVTKSFTEVDNLVK